MKTDVHSWYRNQVFLECDIYQAKTVQKIKIHFMFNKVLFYNRAVYDIMGEKILFSRADHSGNMAQVYCMLVTWSYKHTLRI